MAILLQRRLNYWAITMFITLFVNSIELQALLQENGANDWMQKVGRCIAAAAICVFSKC